VEAIEANKASLLTLILITAMYCGKTRMSREKFKKWESFQKPGIGAKKRVFSKQSISFSPLLHPGQAIRE
jgi:hypothetical protein